MRFELTEEEVKKFLEWQSKHDQSVYTGTIGGRYTFSFTNTTLGKIAKVVDGITKEELVLTDFKEW